MRVLEGARDHEDRGKAPLYEPHAGIEPDIEVSRKHDDRIGMGRRRIDARPDEEHGARHEPDGDESGCDEEEAADHRDE